MVKLTRLVAVFVVAAVLAATGQVALAPEAAAETGDCVTVKGKGGTKSKGYAVVCLKSWYVSGGDQYARITVEQRRRSAPRNVYVKYGFFSGGGYNTGFTRLGPNSNKKRSYARTRSNGDSHQLDGVQVQLCYDVPLRRDPCFTKKLIVGSWNGGGGLIGISG